MKVLLLLVVVLLVFADQSFAGDSKYAVITATPNLQKSKEPCQGGNISGVTGIQKLPDTKIINRPFDLTKLEPGEYVIHFTYSRFEEMGGGCAETETGRYGENEGKDTGQVRISAEAGQVYELRLADDFTAQVTTLSEMPLNPLVVGGIVQTVGSMQRWRDICQNIFPHQKIKFSALYKKSKIPVYAKRFGLERQTETPWTKNKADYLKSLGHTESEAHEWCTVELANQLEKFDYLYGNRVDDVQKFLEQYKP